MQRPRERRPSHTSEAAGSDAADGSFGPDEVEMMTLGVGQCFGESALHADDAERVRSADVRAGRGPGDTVVVRLHADAFRALFGTSLQAVAARNFHRHLLSSVSLDGAKLATVVSSADLNALLDELEMVYFRDGEIVVAAGDAGDALYIIFQGAAEVLDDMSPDQASEPPHSEHGHAVLQRSAFRASHAASC